MKLVGWMAAATALAACGFDGAPGAAGGGDDAPGTVCTSFSAQLDTCVQSFGGPLVLDGAYVFDTDAGMLTRAGVPVEVTTATLSTNAGKITAILADDVQLAPSTLLRAEGAHAFAILSRGSIALGTAATIDVSDGGAGARATCSVGAMPGANDGGGAAGGGGGGFGGAGGNGGKGNLGASAGGTGGAPIAPPSGPLGGCAGAAGGLGDDNDPGGAGGRGGGAVYLAAALEIEIAGSSGIHAGGGGGSGGTKITSNFGDAGGGGGGSGGLIWLEAAVVRSSGILAANGGGGGEASGDGDAGEPGLAGPFGMDRAAGGGDNSPTGTDGGLGGHHLAPDGASVTSEQAGGGGGGGGGVGFVRVTSPDAMLGSLVSPPAS